MWRVQQSTSNVSVFDVRRFLSTLSLLHRGFIALRSSCDCRHKDLEAPEYISSVTPCLTNKSSCIRGIVRNFSYKKFASGGFARRVRSKYVGFDAKIIWRGSQIQNFRFRHKTEFHITNFNSQLLSLLSQESRRTYRTLGASRREQQD